MRQTFWTLWALVACLGTAGWAQTVPHIFYSDLESGPNTGGENNSGAYVTVFGKNFGAIRGNSTVNSAPRSFSEDTMMCPLCACTI